MTLIEILIVIALFALVATGVSMGIGALHRTKLRSAAMDVAAACRFAYHRAVTTGHTVRVGLDLDAHALAIEEADGQVMLAMDDERDMNEEEDDAAVDPWQAAQAALDDQMSAQLNRSTFQVIPKSNGEPNPRYNWQPLPVSDGREVLEAMQAGGREAAMAAGREAEVRIPRLFTPHEREPRETGRGYIYFFPGGRTEHAVVQITDGEDNVYSIEVHALTGRAEIHAYAHEPVELDDESELRDPG